MTAQPIRLVKFSSRTLLAATVVAGLIVALFSPLASPVAADAGIHLVDGPPDAAGCHSLEVWNNDQLVVTIPADHRDVGDGSVNCASNHQSAFLPNGILIFDWLRWSGGFYSGPVGEFWGSNGTVTGTQRLATLGGFRCSPSSWEVVARTAFIATECYGGVTITATRGTPSSTFTLSPNAGQDASVLPLYVVVGNRIVYAAGTPRKGRELWVSDGTRKGSHLLKDIRRGRRSSDIEDLVSDGRKATFTADDGTGRVSWVTNGTRRGTHPKR